MTGEAPRAFVTGASSGIGMAFSRLLAAKGYHLVLHGRQQQRLEALNKELGGQHRVLVADLADPEQLAHLVEEVSHHPPDLLVNNAGFGAYGDIVEIGVDRQLKMVDTNVRAVVALTVTAAKALRDRGHKGTILNISSVAGQLGAYPNLACYAATKAFLNQYGVAADAELRSDGIRVLTACPGRVATEFSERAANGELDRPKSAAWTIMTDRQAAQYLWDQVVAGKTLNTFNWFYRLSEWLGYVLPKWVRLPILAKTIKR